MGSLYYHPLHVKSGTWTLLRFDLRSLVAALFHAEYESLRALKISAPMWLKEVLMCQNMLSLDVCIHISSSSHI